MQCRKEGVGARGRKWQWKGRKGVCKGPPKGARVKWDTGTAQENVCGQTQPLEEERRRRGERDGEGRGGFQVGEEGEAS